MSRQCRIVCFLFHLPQCALGFQLGPVSIQGPVRTVVPTSDFATAQFRHWTVLVLLDDDVSLSAADPVFVGSIHLLLRLPRRRAMILGLDSRLG